VTNAVEIARLADPLNHGLRLWFVGGEMRSESLDTMGASAANALREQMRSGTLEKDKADFCFVGATGISLAKGFCVRTSLEHEIKAAMLELSHTKIVVADSTKFTGSYRGWYTFAQLSLDVTVVTNESDTPPEEAFDERVRLVFAPPV
jgi:DeoR/GlpR family transcriptional regulator of sugar metabolism